MNLIRRTEGQEPALLSRLDPFRAFRDLLRWDPFAEMEPFLGKSDLGITPNFEVKETKDSVVFKADLPGIKEKDVEIAVVGNRLSISGKREEEDKKEDDRYYAYERWYGSFNRTFTLPDACDAEAVKAELKDGVLTISVPKKEGAQPRRVQLGGSGDQTGQENVESKGTSKAA
jgi:HSP20 family protein